MHIVGDNDWGNSGCGWDNKPHAPMPNDEDREKYHPVET